MTPKRQFRFTLRAMLVVMLLLGALLVPVVVRMDETRRQKEAVVAISRLPGSTIVYDYELRQNGQRISDLNHHGPKWLRGILGDDYFRRVEVVNLSGMIDLSGPAIKTYEVTNKDLAYLGSFKMLRQLYVYSGSISDDGLEHLQFMDQLESLYLSADGVTDQGLKHLGEMQNLRSLSIDIPNITDDGLMQLKGLIDLKELGIFIGPRVTEDGIERLQKALPDCKIQWGTHA